MKITLSITEPELIEVIKSHILSKTEGLDVGEVRLYVMSKNNYRVKTWEPAHIIIKNYQPEPSGVPQEETEVRAEVDCE